MPKSHILEVLNEIKGLREDLKHILEPKQSIAPLVDTLKAPLILTPEPEKPHIPVPAEYQEEKNKVLNQDFGLEVSYPSDGRPVFEFSVIVPEKYSNMTQSQKEATKGIDKRPLVIENALGINGVRQWLERVYKNLGPEAQARITADRYV